MTTTQPEPHANHSGCRMNLSGTHRGNRYCLDHHVTVAEPDGLVRAYVIRFTGKNGKKCSVTFERNGQNASVFDGRDDSSTRNQACSNAITAVIAANGPEWIDTYEVDTIR